MGTSYRLTIRFAGTALVAGAFTCPITLQAATLTELTGPITTTSGAFACPVTMKSATTSVFYQGAQDFGTSSAMSDVVWTHSFDSNAEVSAFRVDSGLNADGVPLRTVQRRGMRWLEQTILGSQLAADYTAGAETMVLDDVTYWDTPGIVFPFQIVISNPWPTLPANKNVLNVTAIDIATKTLTVNFPGSPYIGDGFASTAQSYPIGSYVGQDTDSWTRTFSALRAVENGRLVDDRAATGAVGVRSMVAGNSYSVPVDTTPNLRQYGYYVHPDNETLHANWTPYRSVVGVQDFLTPRGPVNGADLKFKVIDGNEFWIELTAELDSRFYLNVSRPDEDNPDGDDGMPAMKWITFDTEYSVLHQLLWNHKSENKWSLPGTNKTPLVMLTNKAGTKVGHDDWARPSDGSHQPGGEWDVTPGFARLLANPNPATSGWPTPDGKLAWEIPTGVAVTYAVRVRPGHSGSQDSQIEVRKAEIEDAGYTGAWTTVINVSDAKLSFGNSSAQLVSERYPDGQITWPTVTLFDTLPGYQSFTLMGYSNVRQGQFPRPFRRSFRRWIARATLRRSVPPPPKSQTLPSYVPAAGQIAAIATGATLTNNMRSNIEDYYDPEQAAKIVEFSSGVINPFWGQYGAMIQFGGGHASTNYNAMHCLEFGASTMTWRRLTTASAFYGTGTDSTTKTNNSQGAITLDATYREPIIGGVQQVGMPAAPHTYDSRDIIGPAHGGAAHGSFIMVAGAEFGYSGGRASHSVHVVDFDSTDGAAGSYAWRRFTNNVYGGAFSTEPPYSTRFAPDQNRIYIETGKSNHAPKYFDLATRTYADAAGTGKAVSPGGNAMSYISAPERKLHLYMGQVGTASVGNLAIQTRAVGASDTDASWSAARTLSAAIPINGKTIHACWCPDIERILIGNVDGDPNCVYEIEIPANLSATWTCTRRAFTGGQIMDWGTNGSWPCGGWSPQLRCWVLARPSKSLATSDVVYLYRPTGT